MKLKATFSDRGLSSLEKGFLPTLERLGKHCELLLGPEEVYLIQDGLETDGACHAAARLAVDVLFEPQSYKVQSRHQNLIAFRCEVALLLRVIRSARSNNAELLEAKLAMRPSAGTAGGEPLQKPFLSFTGRGQNLNMVQDLPISAPFKAAEVDKLKGESELDLCDYYVDLHPEVQRLQAIVDRLKGVSGSLTLHLTRTGDLHLQVREAGLGLDFGAEARGLEVVPPAMALPADTLRAPTASGRLAEASSIEGASRSAIVASKHFAKALASSQATQPAQLLAAVSADGLYVQLLCVYRDPLAAEGFDENITLSYRLAAKDEL